jgi:threonylcarbamoyladenosine tRNA methylthiotransferase MtaB
MAEAEIMVLNTCTVTAAAASDSRQKIRQAHKAGIEQIVVTGCMSTLKPEKTAAMPSVVQVVPNAAKDRLVPDLLQIEINDFDLEPISREPIPGSRLRTRAFIKAQDGCDNKCTFCITTVARGEGRSRPVIEIISDIRATLKGGAQEVVLTGVHLGSWGYDFEAPQHLRDLIQKILEITEVPRLRISSLEPWDLDDAFFDLWSDPRMCRHLHLPLQSGSAATLRRMARKVTPGSFAALVEAARQRIPDVAITTDVIVGFPGETDAEFAESRAFVEEMNFAGAHIFTYSERQGTAAANMPNQVHNFTRKERNEILRQVTDQSAANYQRRFLGQETAVLWESVENTGEGQWALSGLTDNYLRVQATASEPVWNQITPTRLTKIEENSLRGKILELPDTIVL